ncbi:formyltransferase family protein [Akkermansiaceae bacterium]|nr:formyltransferase family protein [Akkermansiaceae bacterium]
MMAPKLIPEEKKRVVIYAGRRRSVATVLLIWALANRTPSVSIVGVVCPSEFNWKRIRGWYRRFGGKVIGKVLTELGLRGAVKGSFNEEHEILRARWRHCKINTTSVSKICKLMNIPFRVVRHINSSEAAETVKHFNPDYSIYSGAGILRSQILQAGRQVLNLHSGPLPAVRGMNALEWSLFLGLQPEVTLHYIDEGIDTGRIISSAKIKVEVDDKIGRLRGKAVLSGIDLLVDSLNEWELRKERENPPSAGKQYYLMSETLKDQLQVWIKQGKTPKSP